MHTKEILAAFLNEVPFAESASADDESSFGIEWHFLDGSLFWIDIDPAHGPRYFWRKGKDGDRHTGPISNGERA